MKARKLTKQLFVACLGLVICSLSASSASRQAQPNTPKDYLKADEKDVQNWREMKFGLFIHWGPVSLKGTEIGWSRGGRGRSDHGSVPVQEYDNLYKKFRPVKFNAREWAQVAKDAGMKYLVFTSKHHDGFSMFDSKYTDYKITNSPFKRDVAKELADACHKAGLKLGYYYSPVDWYHPDYRTENHSKYIEFMHNQLREICTNYGTIDVIWFDDLRGSAKDWDSERLFKMIRTLQPHVIINNRAGLSADHDTPEQRIGKFQNVRPWETCMTICRQWAWKPNDDMKSLKQCLHTLINVVAGDGNLLFNVGPMPDGRIEPRQVQRLKQMGQWLKKYGRTIYATRGGPFKTGSWGGSTFKANTIFVHVLNWPDDPLILPAIPAKITDAKLVTSGSLKTTQTEQCVEISVPEADRHEINTIIELTLDRPASEIAPRVISSDSLTSGKKATASNTLQNNRAYGPDKAVDNDPATRWATEYGVRQATLDIDLGKPTTFDRARICEEYDRIQRFQIQYRDGDAWKTFDQGAKVGSNYRSQFSPITARYVRLNILDAAKGPTIWEFQLFASRR